MNQLDLDFIVRRRWPWRLLLPSAVGAIWLAYQTAVYCQRLEQYQTGAHQLATARQQQSQRRDERAQAELAAQPSLRRQQQMREKIRAALAYPWDDTMAAIEQPNVADVALLSYIHDRSNGRSQLMVEALDFAALERLVVELNQFDAARPWYIASYQTSAQNTPPTVKALLIRK